MKQWAIKERCRLGTAAVLEKLRAKLQGHFNYYGVSGNFDMLQAFYRQACSIVFKWLNRRSQRTNTAPPNHRLLDLKRALVRSEQY